jgi:hypothetical protein
MQEGNMSGKQRWNGFNFCIIKVMTKHYSHEIGELTILVTEFLSTLRRRPLQNDSATLQSTQ